MNEDEQIEKWFYKHDDCTELHTKLSDIRKCAGRWVHRDEIDTVIMRQVRDNAR